MSVWTVQPGIILTFTPSDHWINWQSVEEGSRENHLFVSPMPPSPGPPEDSLLEAAPSIYTPVLAFFFSQRFSRNPQFLIPVSPWSGASMEEDWRKYRKHWGRIFSHELLGKNRDQYPPAWFLMKIGTGFMSSAEAISGSSLHRGMSAWGRWSCWAWLRQRQFWTQAETEYEALGKHSYQTHGHYEPRACSSPCSARM